MTIQKLTMTSLFCKRHDGNVEGVSIPYRLTDITASRVGYPKRLGVLEAIMLLLARAYAALVNCSSGFGSPRRNDRTRSLHQIHSASCTAAAVTGNVSLQIPLPLSPRVSGECIFRASLLSAYHSSDLRQSRSNTTTR